MEHQKARIRVLFLLYNENHAIVAWFNKGYADKQTTNNKLEQNVFVRKAPSGRELSPKATEGARATKSFLLDIVSSSHL